MKITKKEFERLYYSKTNKEVGKILNIDQHTVINMARKHGLKMKGKGNHYSNTKVKII